jgi:hypothetical protein
MFIFKSVLKKIVAVRYFFGFFLGVDFWVVKHFGFFFFFFSFGCLCFYNVLCCFFFFLWNCCCEKIRDSFLGAMLAD